MPGNNGDTAPAVIDHPVKTLEDIDRLKVPDFEKELPGAYAVADQNSRAVCGAWDAGRVSGRQRFFCRRASCRNNAVF